MALAKNPISKSSGKTIQKDPILEKVFKIVILINGVKLLRYIYATHPDEAISNVDPQDIPYIISVKSFANCSRQYESLLGYNRVVSS